MHLVHLSLPFNIKRLKWVFMPLVASTLVAALWFGLLSLAPAPAWAQMPFSCANVSEIPQSHCNALVALYSSTDGSNWLTKTGWLQTNTPCSWYGILCREGQLEINLQNNHLTGTLLLDGLI